MSGVIGIVVFWVVYAYLEYRFTKAVRRLVGADNQRSDHG